MTNEQEFDSFLIATNKLGAKNLDDIFLADSIIFEREAYRNALSAGMGVSEYCNKNENAYKDFEKFFNELVWFANS